VKARLPDGDEKTVVDESNFKVLFKSELEELAPTRKLTASEGPADLLLAAAAFERYGILDEALKVFEKLASKQPKVIRYQLALARYYRHAGRPDRAKEALQKAKKLGAALED
jgi:tetratricopeptide (TPR) repeat protein